MNSNQAVFELGEYRCTSGMTLQDVRIGYETYGTFSPEKDNVILVCHYSHDGMLGQANSGRSKLE